MTCEQAKDYCLGGVYIPPERICTSYPDSVDKREQTCLSEESWLCNQIEYFRHGRHNQTTCLQFGLSTVEAIGAKLKSVRLWNENGKKVVPYFFKQGDHTSTEQATIRQAFKEMSESIDCVSIVAFCD